MNLYNLQSTPSQIEIAALIEIHAFISKFVPQLQQFRNVNQETMELVVAHSKAQLSDYTSLAKVQLSIGTFNRVMADVALKLGMSGRDFYSENLGQ